MQHSRFALHDSFIWISYLRTYPQLEALASLLMYCIREMLQLEAWFWVRFDSNWYQLDEHLRIWSVTTQKSFVGLNNPFNNMLAGAILMVLTFARQMPLSAAVHRHIFFHAHYTLWANSIESYKENHSNVLYLDISNDVMGESPTSVLCAWELTSMLQNEFVMFLRHTYISEYQLLITVIDIQIYLRMFLFWLTHISYDGLAMGFICQKLHLPPRIFVGRSSITYWWKAYFASSELLILHSVTLACFHKLF